MKKTLILLFAAVCLFSVKASAQRTSIGYNIISADLPCSFSAVGIASLEYGRYTASGYWFTHVTMPLYGVNAVSTVTGGKQISQSLYFGDLSFGGGYMWRILHTRSRWFNLYGGPGGFLGCEFVDPFKKFDSSNSQAVQNTYSMQKFIFGVDAKLLAEFYVSQTFALTAALRVPVTFTTQLPQKVHFEAKVGVRYSF